MTSLMLAGLGIAGAAFGARLLIGSFKQIQKTASQLPKSPLFTSYYKGGFDPKMSKREAGLILGRSAESVSLHFVVLSGTYSSSVLDDPYQHNDTA